MDVLEAFNADMSILAQSEPLLSYSKFRGAMYISLAYYKHSEYRGLIVAQTRPQKSPPSELLWWLSVNK